MDGRDLRQRNASSSLIKRTPDFMRLNNRKIKAIIFDLGETILSFECVNEKKVFAKSAGLSYQYILSLGQPVGSYKMYCLRNMTILKIRYWLSNLLNKDFDALELLKKINKSLTLTQSQWEELFWLWYEPLSRLGKIESDLIPTLTKLKAAGIKLGILSNTFIHSSSIERHLRQLKILDFFSVRLYSYQFAFRKPDIRIFESAAKQIGELPQNILFVGDRIKNDIKPAVAAGMNAVLKNAYTNQNDNIPDGVQKINKLSELPDLIDNFSV
jgi:putative hydrolase of the HAD superfamily